MSGLTVTRAGAALFVAGIFVGGISSAMVVRLTAPVAQQPVTSETVAQIQGVVPVTQSGPMQPDDPEKEADKPSRLQSASTMQAPVATTTTGSGESSAPVTTTGMGEPSTPATTTTGTGTGDAPSPVTTTTGTGEASAPATAGSNFVLPADANTVDTATAKLRSAYSTYADISALHGIGYVDDDAYQRAKTDVAFIESAVKNFFPSVDTDGLWKNVQDTRSPRVEDMTPHDSETIEESGAADHLKGMLEMYELGLHQDAEAFMPQQTMKKDFQ